MITRENYEIYIIDYLDGTLTDEQSKSLMEFLRANPDLQEEFELIKDVELPNENIIFNDKKSLKKSFKQFPITEETIDEWSIAALENELTADEINQFEKALSKNVFFANTHKLYLKTKLTTEKVHYSGTLPYQIPNFEAEPELEDAPYWIIAELEDDLSKNQLAKWKSFKFNNREIENLESEFQKTFLKVEEIVFPNKKALKKRSIRKHLYPLSGIAAAAALVFFYLQLINISNNTYDSYNAQVAIVNKQNVQNQNPSSMFINPILNRQVVETITHFAMESKQEINGKIGTTNKTNQRQEEKIEQIELRKIDGNQYIKRIKQFEPEVEVVQANELLLAPNNFEDAKQNEFTLAEDNRLTLFKAAQKSVDIVNNKIGTDMKLEKEPQQNGKQKRVSFSTRRFSITKTIN